MPKGRKKKVPLWGRSQTDLDNELAEELNYSSDVPLGNTDPTVVQGVILGGMPNASRMARGRLRAYRGKYE